MDFDLAVSWMTTVRALWAQFTALGTVLARFAIDTRGLEGLRVGRIDLADLGGDFLAEGDDLLGAGIGQDLPQPQLLP